MDTSTVAQRVDTLGRRVALRRHRSVEEKRRIIAEARSAASVAAVARQHGINANLIFAWMRQEEQGQLRARTRRPLARLLSVRLRAEPAPEPEPVMALAETARVEISLADGVSVRIVGDVPSERIERVLRLLRR